MAIKGGDVGGETYDINLGNEGEVIEFNDDFDVPADVMSARRGDLIAAAQQWRADDRRRRRRDGDRGSGAAAPTPGTEAAPAGTDAPATTAG